MSAYQTFVSTRTTDPDPVSLLAALRGVDASIGYASTDAQHYRVKKATAFTAADLAACQTAIDTCPATSPALIAQAWVDRMPLEEKALFLVTLDEINRLREWIASLKAAVAASTSLANMQSRIAALPDTPDRTVAQGIQAVRDKAGSL